MDTALCIVGGIVLVVLAGAYWMFQSTSLSDYGDEDTDGLFDPWGGSYIKDHV